MNEGVEGFTASRLTLARERRGITQTRLSELVGVSARTIKAYEAASSKPTEGTLDEISRVLSFPRAFFVAPPIERLMREAASFRALTRASASLRNRTIAAGTLALEFHSFLADRFDLPPLDVPDHRGLTPAAAAECVRLAWGIGQKPIGNVVHLLELHGVRVFSLSEDCNEIDAFSVWSSGTPFVFLNSQKTSERSIFDAAHELGHLVLHRHGEPQGRELEKEADAFAGAFLLPEAGVRATAPSMPTIASLTRMKRTWRTSVAALGYRMHELGLMSAWHYKHFSIELSRRGRSNEPEPLGRETSAILKKALSSLLEDGVTLRDVARELALPINEVQALAFGLHIVEGNGARGGPAEPGGSRGAHLRLVT